MVLGCLTFSCTRKVYVPVENVRTEYRDRDRNSVRIDSVIEADTRIIYINGDTVRDYRTRWRERIREVHDTVKEEQQVTVTKTKTVTVEVKRKPTVWQRIKKVLSGFLIGAVAAFVIHLIWNLAIRNYKRR
jgi:gas vesicle protein